jgi:hypothetical protein
MATSTLSPNARAAPSEFEANVTAQPSAEPNSAMNTADIVVETLISWGAPFVFGIVGEWHKPGDRGVAQAAGSHSLHRRSS